MSEQHITQKLYALTQTIISFQFTDAAEFKSHAFLFRILLPYLKEAHNMIENAIEATAKRHQARADMLVKYCRTTPLNQIQYNRIAELYNPPLQDNIRHLAGIKFLSNKIITAAVAALMRRQELLDIYEQNIHYQIGHNHSSSDPRIHWPLTIKSLTIALAKRQKDIDARARTNAAEQPELVQMPIDYGTENGTIQKLQLPILQKTQTTSAPAPANTTTASSNVPSTTTAAHDELFGVCHRPPVNAWTQVDSRKSHIRHTLDAQRHAKTGDKRPKTTNTKVMSALTSQRPHAHDNRTKKERLQRDQHRVIYRNYRRIGLQEDHYGSRGDKPGKLIQNDKRNHNERGESNRPTTSLQGDWVHGAKNEWKWNNNNIVFPLPMNSIATSIELQLNAELINYILKHENLQTLIQDCIVWKTNVDYRKVGQLHNDTTAHFFINPDTFSRLRAADLLSIYLTNEVNTPCLLHSNYTTMAGHTNCHCSHFRVLFTELSRLGFVPNEHQAVPINF